MNKEILKLKVEFAKLSFADYLKAKAEIAKICGVTEQCVRKWVRCERNPTYLAKKEINKYFNKKIFEV